MTELRNVHPNHPDLLLLVGALDRFFVERYGPATLKYQKHHDLSRISCAMVAYVDGIPAACCCWRAAGSAAEIKRLFVRPAYRGQGLARRLVTAIERHAAAAGHRRFVLETGSDMADAIAVYTRLGYRLCPNFGDFAGDRQVACMEKELAGGS